jgi:hypothetical protein
MFEGSELESQQGQKLFSEAFSLGVKWQKHEADHSPARQVYEYVYLHIHSLIQLHGVVLNSTPLPITMVKVAGSRPDEMNKFFQFT